MALPPSDKRSNADKEAARDQARQDVFMREVDEAVRQDQLLAATRRFGWPVLGLIVLGLAALGGWLYWQSEVHAAAEADAVALTLAVDRIEAGRIEEAGEKVAGLTDSEAAAYRVPAQMIEAAVALKNGERDKAAGMFDGIAADENVPSPLRDLATIRAVAIRYDTMNPEDVVARLKPMATPGNPWFASAAELVGMAYVEQDKGDLAGPLFAEIAKDDDAPQTMRARARQIAGLLGVDTIDDPQEVAELIARNSAARRDRISQ